MFRLIPFLSYVFVTSFTPGPNNIMSMTVANQYGFRKAMPFNLGVSFGVILIMILCGLFDLFLYNLLPSVQFWMELLGALYMTFLAYTVIKSKPRTDEADSAPPGSFVSGMLLQFVNPKVILYGITVISGFILPYYTSSLALILFALFLAVVGFISTSCWSFFGALFQGYLARYQSAFNAVMAILLLYCAVSVLL